MSPEETCVNLGCRNMAPQDEEHLLEITIRGVAYSGFGCDPCLNGFSAQHHELLTTLARRAVEGKRLKPPKTSVHALMREDLRKAVAAGHVKADELLGLDGRGRLPNADVIVHQILADQGLVKRRLPKTALTPSRRSQRQHPDKVRALALSMR